MFFKKKSDYQINLKSTEVKVTYGEAEGFFEFRGVIYYKAKGTSGKAIDDMSASFTSSIKALYPNEFDVKEMTAVKVSKIEVTPLTVMQ